MDLLRKRKVPLPSVIRHLPVKSISDKNINKFVAYFVGASIEVYNDEQIQELQTCGCFGDIPFRHRKTESHYLLQKVSSNDPTAQLEAVSTSGGKEVRITPGTSTSTIDLQKTNEVGLTEEVMSVDSGEEVEDTKPEVKPVLTLYHEEAFFLHFSLRCLTVKDSKNDSLTTEDFFKKLVELNPQFVTRFIAYHYFRSKNWVVRSGIKFGSDFLLYNLGPRYYHAKYMVIVKRAGGEDTFHFPSKETLAWYRIGETTGKECVILEVKYPETKGNKFNDFSLLQNISLFKVNHVRLKRMS